ncbi:unnamed protein product, partial [Prorocentrum cordatum]
MAPTPLGAAEERRGPAAEQGDTMGVELFFDGSAIGTSIGHLTIWTNCDLMITGWHHDKRCCYEWMRSYREIWIRFLEVATDYGLELLALRKARAHTTRANRERGIVGERERPGNSVTGTLAKQGAKLHDVDGERFKLSCF